MSGVRWFATREVYIVTLKYLCGVHLSQLIKQYPGTQWRIYELDNTPRTAIFHNIAHFRCRAFLAETASELDAVIDEVNSYLQELPYPLRWDDTIKKCNDLSVKRSRLLRILQGHLKYFIGFIERYFPVVVPKGYLRKVFVGEHSIGMLDVARCIALQEVLPGGYVEMEPSQVKSWSTDTDVMNSIYASSADSINWPDSVLSDWYCTLKSSGNGRDLRVVVLVDGENIHPMDFLFFVKYQLRVSPGTKIECVVFAAEDNALHWQFVQCHLETPLEVKVVKRLVETKSLMDFSIYTEVSMRYFRDEQRDFVIMSSDSDYSPLYSAYKEATFRFVCHYGHTAKVWVQRMKEDGIDTYWLDESVQLHNISVFNVQYLVWRAREFTGDIFRDDDWVTFLNRIGWKTPSSAATRARYILINVAQSGIRRKEVLI